VRSMRWTLTAGLSAIRMHLVIQSPSLWQSPPIGFEEPQRVIAYHWVLPNSPMNRLDRPYSRFRPRLDSLISSLEGIPATGLDSQPPNDPQGVEGGGHLVERYWLWRPTASSYAARRLGLDTILAPVRRQANLDSIFARQPGRHQRVGRRRPVTQVTEPGLPIALSGGSIRREAGRGLRGQCRLEGQFPRAARGRGPRTE
jgi:hypothetical protein